MVIFWVIVGIVFIAFSVRWNWWRMPASGVPILMYHKIGRAPSDAKIKKLWVSVRAFERQMAYLKDHRYRSITFAELAGQAAVPEKPVIITFDDGYLNNYIDALPVLRKYGFKAVFFIVSSTVGRHNLWHDPAEEKQIPMMDTNTLKRLVQEGHEIGSHTVSHIDLEKADPGSVDDELQKSKSDLERMIESSIISFAYPYGAGAFSSGIPEAVAQAGYQYACSIRQGIAQLEKNVLNLRRILVRGDDNRLDFYLNMTRGKSRF